MPANGHIGSTSAQRRQEVLQVTLQGLIGSLGLLPDLSNLHNRHIDVEKPSASYTVIGKAKIQSMGESVLMEAYA